MYQRTKIEDYIWTDGEFWAPFAECAALCSQLQPATNLFGVAQLFPSRHSSPGCQASITTSSMISKLQDDRFQAKQKDDNSFGWSPLSFLGICILPISIWKYIYDSSFYNFKMIYFVVCLIIELKL